MGIVHPPWIDEDIFQQYTFNYCDHFGDKEELALMCKICRDEVKMHQKHKNGGRDPYDLENVFFEISKSFQMAHEMLKKDAKRFGIDIDNLEDIPDEEEIDESTFEIYRIAEIYGKVIMHLLQDFESFPLDTDHILIEKALDAFSHSQLYVQVKVSRAIHSSVEDTKDPEIQSEDAKTSALLAYLALDRNGRACIALANHHPLINFRKKFMALAHKSFTVAEIVHQEFFPDYPTNFDEFGVESYEKAFG